MNTGTRLILRTAIQAVAAGAATAAITEWLDPFVGDATLALILFIVVATAQNLAENMGIEWLSPVKRPDKVAPAE